MKKFFGVITSSALTIAAYITLGGSSVSAQGATQAGVAAAHGTGTPTTLFGNGGVITNVTNVLLFVAGALAVVMVIVGGFRYATSAGNSSSVTAAKNTILYAIVGLIIAFFAFAIVNFILGALTPGSNGFTNA